MNNIYPASPAGVPDDLTRPGPRYSLKIWQAMLVLLLFIACYLGLSSWFVIKGYQLFTGMSNGSVNGLTGVLAGGCAWLLALFMLKALFFIRHDGKIDDIEIKASQHPDFFAFLHRLADETGAPRPQRVFLSPRVNAAVFYDLSLLTLFWPGKKNLEIGLALVNVLTLAEFKAVLAHEFGHFAQRSMALGRWVYLAQQVAGLLITRRDALDRLLEGLSYSAPQIAWAGWLLKLIIWSIRSLIELSFRVVVLAQRALSREMEMQADLVAVSVSGSDALIHALHKMDAADEAWDRTIDFANEEYAAGHVNPDLFAVQSRLITLLSGILADPLYGQPPELPAQNRAQHRVFHPDFAQPPKMWATHPLNHEREENAKRRYIAADLTDQPAWDIFTRPQALREQMSAHIFRHCTDKPATCPLAESLARLEQRFKRNYYDPRYRGTYIRRSPVRHAYTPEELYLAPGLSCQTAELYPETLPRQLETLRRLQREQALLQSLIQGHWTTPDGVIRFRNQTLKAGQLKSVLEGVKTEVRQAAAGIAEHDQRCRSAHLELARAAGGGWPEYLQGLAAVLHYAGHTSADLRDARHALSVTVSAATAGRRISDDGRIRVRRAAGILYSRMCGPVAHASFIVLNEELLQRMGIESWYSQIGHLDIPYAHDSQLGDWLDAVDGWVNLLTTQLDKLSNETLECLLRAEDLLATSSQPAIAPAAPQVLRNDYPVLPAGEEREPETQSGWLDRFMAADGHLPTAARFAVAAGIVGTVLSIGTHLNDQDVTIYNGLEIPVVVNIAGETRNIGAGMANKISITPDPQMQVTTTTDSGELIETFRAPVINGQTTLFYNVASASPLQEWTALYGYSNNPPEPDLPLGIQRWGSSHASVLFAAPPQQINSRYNDRLTVLSGYAGKEPQLQLNLLADPAQQQSLIRTQLRWAPADSPQINGWLQHASMLPDFEELLRQRLQKAPEEVITRRFRQDSGKDRAAICNEDRKRAEQKPADANRSYLAARCLENQTDRDQAFASALQHWPANGWLQMVNGYISAENSQWQSAVHHLDSAMRASPVVANYIGPDLLRIRRMAGLPEKEDDPERKLSTVKSVLEQEQDLTTPQNQQMSYTALQAGELKRALSLATETTPGDAQLIRLIAASEGAAPEWIKQAEGLNQQQGLNPDTLPVTLALQTRLKQDTRATVARLNESYLGHAPVLLSILEAARHNLPATEIDKMIAPLQPYVKGQACAMLLVLKQEQAAPAWRDAARRLLFKTERPYFKPAPSAP